MSSKTKIIVLHMKEVIYTCIFLLSLVILGVLVFFMFGPESTEYRSKDRFQISCTHTNCVVIAWWAGHRTGGNSAEKNITNWTSSGEIMRCRLKGPAVIFINNHFAILTDCCALKCGRCSFGCKR